MKNAASMIEFSALFFLFLTALISGSYLFETTHRTMVEADSTINGRDRNLIETPLIEGSETVDGASVVQSIFQIAEINADIQVDGLLYDKNLNMDYTDVSMINVNDMYRTEYQRDSDGILQKLIFRRV
ncbi:hypothetical protein IAQ67_14960 [Paenibacillus peoriae]|uniref:Uncharacterized protein n=1 Tax=Paenibacillus peoriae TaxID=59893 RepID=A0A7H0Y2A6_9BACL|nr:hypothetical protein [Paenibacillus peoriae]QNR65214.1 hypothetical protein IAQ67_14960 [Paenibacillus peoriae]